MNNNDALVLFERYIKIITKYELKDIGFNIVPYKKNNFWWLLNYFYKSNNLILFCLNEEDHSIMLSFNYKENSPLIKTRLGSLIGNHIRISLCFFPYNHNNDIGHELLKDIMKTITKNDDLLDRVAVLSSVINMLDKKYTNFSY